MLSLRSRLIGVSVASVALAALFMLVPATNNATMLAMITMPTTADPSVKTKSLATPSTPIPAPLAKPPAVATQPPPAAIPTPLPPPPPPPSLKAQFDFNLAVATIRDNAQQTLKFAKSVELQTLDFNDRFNAASPLIEEYMMTGPERHHYVHDWSDLSSEFSTEALFVIRRFLAEIPKSTKTNPIESQKIIETALGRLRYIETIQHSRIGKLEILTKLAESHATKTAAKPITFTVSTDGKKTPPVTTTRRHDVSTHTEKLLAKWRDD